MLDCDGTLAPFARHYLHAVFPKKTRKVLEGIKRLKNIKIAIISGRSLSSVQRFVGVRGLIYAGNHGLEISTGAERRSHPKAEKYLKVISELKGILKALLEYFPDACLEDKHFGLSLHYRMLAPAAEKKLFFAFKSAVRPFVKGRKIKLLRGSKVLEIRPFVHWNKGHAVRWLLRNDSREPILPVFIGDDITDEDAFKALRHGITICVGRSKNTHARFYLKSHLEVYRLLEAFYRARRQSIG